MSLVAVFVFMIVLLLLKGFFSGSEIALVSVNKIRMRHQARLGNRGAALFLEMFRKPDRLLTTTLVGTNLATVAFTTLGTIMMVEAFGHQGDLIAFLVFTPLLLVLGEIVPKSVYQQKAEALTPIIVYPLRVAAFLFYPILFVFSQVARLALRAIGGSKTAQSVFLTREQLRAVLEMTERRSNIAVFKRGHIRRAIRFGQTQAAEVMTPLRDLTLVNVSDGSAALQQAVQAQAYRPLPVYRGNTANIVAVVALRPWDLITEAPDAAAAADRAGPPYYAAPQQQLAELLPVLRERRDQSAVIVDEYGSAVGLLTFEDVLEVVVGEVKVGYHFEQPTHRRRRSFQVIEEGVYLLDAQLSISDVNDVIGLTLPAESYRTIAGMLLTHLKHIPQPGERVVEFGYRFTVVEATEKEIVTVKAEPAE